MINLPLAFQAKTFFETYQILKQQGAELAAPRYLVPMVVNGAFFAELALKSILTENHIQYKKSIT